jgi:hypothetical protein
MFASPSAAPFPLHGSCGERPKKQALVMGFACPTCWTPIFHHSGLRCKCCGSCHSGSGAHCRWYHRHQSPRRQWQCRRDVNRAGAPKYNDCSQHNTEDRALLRHRAPGSPGKRANKKAVQKKDFPRDFSRGASYGRKSERPASTRTRTSSLGARNSASQATARRTGGAETKTSDSIELERRNKRHGAPPCPPSPVELLVGLAG